MQQVKILHRSTPNTISFNRNLNEIILSFFKNNNALVVQAIQWRTKWANKQRKNYRYHQMAFPWDNFLLSGIKNSYLYEFILQVDQQFEFNLDGNFRRDLQVAKEKCKLRILIAVTNTFEYVHMHTHTHGLLGGLAKQQWNNHHHHHQ